MTNDKTALDALDRLENDALSGRDGYGDARKDAEIIRNFINTRPQPSGDAVDGKDYKKLYWDLLESWSDLKIKHGVLQEKLEAALTQPCGDAVEALDDFNKKAEECHGPDGHWFDIDGIKPETVGAIRAALTQPSICKDGLPKLTQENPYVTQPKADYNDGYQDGWDEGSENGKEEVTEFDSDLRNMIFGFLEKREQIEKGEEYTVQDIFDALVVYEQYLKNTNKTPKADVEGLKSEAWHELQKQAPNCNVAWAVNFIIDHLAAQGYIGGGWQPIEIAPRDGEYFLVCLPRMMNLIMRARFDTVHKQWLSERDNDGAISRVEFFHAGDFWMPMPKPPAAPKKEGE